MHECSKTPSSLFLETCCMPLNYSAPFVSQTSSPIGRAGTNSNSGNALFEVAPLKRLSFSRQRCCSSWSRYETVHIGTVDLPPILPSRDRGSNAPTLFLLLLCLTRAQQDYIRRVVLVDSVRIIHGIGGRYRSASRFAEIWLIFRAR